MAVANSTTSARVRVVLYLRASSDDQTESIPAQRMLLERYAQDHALEIVGEYSDFAISGDSCRSRPELQRMLADARKGIFEGILVRQLSRLSRRNSIKSARQIIDPLLDAGITIYTASHGDLKLDSSTGRIMLAVLSEFDHSENVSRSLNVLNGQLRAAQNGSWIGSAPYAYRVVGPKGAKRIEIEDQSKAAIVRRIFDLFASGKYGTHVIARILNEEGIPSSRGGKWACYTITDILRRPAYVGDHRFNHISRGKYYTLQDGNPVERRGHWIDDDQERPKTTINGADDWVCIRDHWPAIVGRETWDRCQERLDQRQGARSPGSQHTFVLSGLLRCSCGSTHGLHGRFHAKRKRYQCAACGAWVDESVIVQGMADGVKALLTPRAMNELRQELERQLEKPAEPVVDIGALEKALVNQERKLVMLDADMLGPVQAEIRRLRRQIDQARKSARQNVQTDNQAVLDRTLTNLFRLPEVLLESDESDLKANLPEIIDHIEVKVTAIGTGPGKRWTLREANGFARCRVEGGVRTARRGTALPQQTSRLSSTLTSASQ